MDPHATYRDPDLRPDLQQLGADGVTAGVVGLIAVTTIGLFQIAVTDLPSLGIFITSLLALYRWKSKAIIPLVMLCAGALGLFFHFIR